MKFLMIMLSIWSLNLTSTALAAIQDNRRFVGYEISDQYISLAEERLRAFQSGEKFRPPAKR